MKSKTEFYELQLRFYKKQIKKKNKIIIKLKDLIEVNSIISASLNKTVVLKRILNKSKELMDCEKASVLLVDHETNQLKFAVLSNEEDLKALADIRLNMGEGIAGSVWENGKPILIKDTSKDFRFCKKVDEKVKNVTRTIIAVPLVVDGKIIGVMEAINKKNEKYFNSFDLEIFQELSIQAAVAIENAQLYEMAVTDGKTKLFIHRYFQQKLYEELNRSKRNNSSIAVIMFDIDHFKKFNDNYGHQMGDEILIKTAGIIKSYCKDFDVPCRFGGEEFSVILVNTSRDDAFNFAEKVRKSIENMEIKYLDKIIKLTISAGIAIFPEMKAETIEEFVEKADKALYYSKESGRNRVSIYNDNMEKK